MFEVNRRGTFRYKTFPITLVFGVFSVFGHQTKVSVNSVVYSHVSLSHSIGLFHLLSNFFIVVSEH